MRYRDIENLMVLGFWLFVISLPVMAVAWLVDWYRSLPVLVRWAIPVVAVAGVVAVVVARSRSRRRAAAQRADAARRRAEQEREAGERRAAAAREAAARQAALDRQIAQTDGMTGTEFEHLVRRLLRSAGWNARVVGGANDLGMDVEAVDGRQRRLVVQCKRLGEKAVGSKDMQAFLGTHRAIHRADVSAFVTTSRFTKAATDLGRGAGIVLVDRPALARWMTHGVPAELRPHHDVAPKAQERRPSAPSTPAAVPTPWFDALDLVLDRAEIEAGEYGDGRAALDRLLEDGLATALRGRVSVTVHGYEDDPRELFVVPEVRAFLRDTEDFPWAYFLREGDPMLTVVVFALAGAESVAPGQAKVPRGRLEQVVERMTSAVVRHADEHGVAEVDTRAALDALQGYLRE